MAAVTGAAGLMLLAATPANAQTGVNVLVVANASSEASVRIAERYAQSRAVPAGQVLRLEGLPADPPDEIDRTGFDRVIQAPLAQWLTANAAQDRIHFIVLTKGVPLRIAGSSGLQGTVASVDSELTLLYRRMAGGQAATAGFLANPYFVGDADPAVAPAFTHQRYDLFLVTRLDGFTVEDVMGLIERGASPSKAGQFVLDEKSAWTDKGNAWLRSAADRLKAAGFTDRVLLDATSAVLRGQKGVLGYYSWGSNDPAIKTRRFDLQFEPGAIAGMFVSTDGRTFREPPTGWQIGTWDDRRTHYAGSPQSLAGDLIREGVTGVAAHVAEPYLSATIRPDILFPAYVSGRSLAESYYLAMPAVSWQTIVVGDPLCAPFQARTAPPGQFDPGVDDATDMPRWFSARRLAASVPEGSSRDASAVRLLLRAEVHNARGDAVGTRRLLEEATAKDDTLLGAHMLLGTGYEAEGDYDRAIDHYRRVLAASPGHLAALNNLAWILAVHKHAPREALPLAQNARGLAPGSAAVADTLGWIYHLLADHAQAVVLLEEAAKGSPGDATMLVHLASAYKATGRDEDARRELGRALQLDPTLERAPDVIRLRAMLN